MPRGTGAKRSSIPPQTAVFWRKDIYLILLFMGPPGSPEVRSARKAAFLHSWSWRLAASEFIFFFQRNGSFPKRIPLNLSRGGILFASRGIYCWSPQLDRRSVKRHFLDVSPVF